jgi:Domain of unknown function (DUF4296)
MLKQQYWGIVIIFCSVLLACNIGSKPNDLLPPQTMIAILEDIHLIEAKVTKHSLASTDSSNMLYNAWERKIFQKHQIDTAVYHRSYRYYIEHTDEFTEIYQQIIKNLEAREKASNVKQ